MNLTLPFRKKVRKISVFRPPRHMLIFTRWSDTPDEFQYYKPSTARWTSRCSVGGVSPTQSRAWNPGKRPHSSPQLSHFKFGTASPQPQVLAYKCKQCLVYNQAVATKNPPPPPSFPPQNQPKPYMRDVNHPLSAGPAWDQPRTSLGAAQEQPRTSPVTAQDNPRNTPRKPTRTQCQLGATLWSAVCHTFLSHPHTWSPFLPYTIPIPAILLDVLAKANLLAIPATIMICCRGLFLNPCL